MRETGYYWVRDSEGWDIACWWKFEGKGGFWWRCGNALREGDFEAVHEERIVPPE